MQLRRLYFSAITLVAVFGIATVVMLPWLSLPGLGIGWNGLGRTSDTGLAESGFTPEARGWYVIAACAIAVLAACTLLRSRTKGTAPALWLAALCSAGGAAVPIVVLTDPDWFLGGLLREVGAVAYLDRGYDLLNVPVLSFCAGAMILLTVLCAATALTVSPLRWRITVTRTDTTATPEKAPAKPKTLDPANDDDLESAESEPEESGPEESEPEESEAAASPGSDDAPDLGTADAATTDSADSGTDDPVDDPRDPDSDDQATEVVDEAAESDDDNESDNEDEPPATRSGDSPPSA